jgi:spore coat polysaccharide biosynthesis predicted glycosyltransferase SpsG
MFLAKKLKQEDKNIKILFATMDLPGNINKKILKSGFSIYSLSENTIKDLDYFIKGLFIDFLIIYSPTINDYFEQQLKLMNKDLKILSFDDDARFHKADFVFNGSIDVKKSDYKKLVPKSTKVYCGSKYTLLEDEYLIKYKKKIEEKSIAIILEDKNIELASKISNYLLEIDNEYKVEIITDSYLDGKKDFARFLSKKELIICENNSTLFKIMALKKKFINLELKDNQKTITKFLEENSLNTTIRIDQLSIRKLEKKIEYIKKKYIYRKLDLEFSKDGLVEKVLNELK